MSDTKQIVIKIVADILHCDVNSLSENSRLGRHENWDSLAQMSILLELEERYSITVDENNIDQLLSISDICKYIDSLGISPNSIWE